MSVTTRVMRVMPWAANQARARAQNPTGGVRGLIGQVLGVGEPGEPVDRGVQVDVAGAGAGHLGSVDGSVVVGAAAVGPTTAAVGDPADLLHIQVHHVAAVAGGDPAGLAE